MDNKWICCKCGHRNPFLRLRCAECTNRRWDSMNLSNIDARILLTKLVKMDRAVSMDGANKMIVQYNAPKNFENGAN